MRLSKSINLLLIVFLLGLAANAQQKEKPKLVVGIVVDQMRYDYISKFWNNYTEGGFKRLVNKGFNCRNTHFNYAPTYTGPGHASIYTGTTPRYHGIIANYWYDKYSKSGVYCAGDAEVKPLGTNANTGKMSPNNMFATTITDELRLSTNMNSKVIGISLKDRGAILPAGHSANGAYWLETTDSTVNWISSGHYNNTLPTWVTSFNASESVVKYYDEVWNPLFARTKYLNQNSSNKYEQAPEGMATADFPYNLKNIGKDNGGYAVLKFSPYGNSIVTDFALEAIKQEELGKDQTTDFIAISYSTPDYVGHQFGPHSLELEDTYIRLDRDLQHLFQELDKSTGKGNYTVFLTADHAAVSVPAYLNDHKLPGGYFETDSIKNYLSKALNTKYGNAKWIEVIANNHIFLNHLALDSAKIEREKIVDDIKRYLLPLKEVDKAIAGKDLANGIFSEGVEYLVQNGYHQKLSGDVVIIPKPGYIDYPEQGTTHGSPYNYDTHVPLLWYGWGIKKGESIKKVNITDIAVTLSFLLDIQQPSASTGKVIKRVLK